MSHLFLEVESGIVVLDRPTIEMMLQQIQAGELSLEQATQRLLDDQSGCETQLPETQLPETQPLETQPLETLASLLGRLGHPPRDIAEIWCDQFRILVAELPYRSRDVSLDDFEITDQGELAWCGDADFLSVPNDDAAVDEAVLSFRNQVLDEPADPAFEPKLPKRIQEQEPAFERPEKKRPSRIPNLAIAVGLVMCAVALFWILRGTPISEVASTDTRSTEALNADTADTNIFDPSPGFPSPPPADRRGFASELELPIETFDTGELETSNHSARLNLNRSKRPPKSSLRSRSIVSCPARLLRPHFPPLKHRSLTPMSWVRMKVNPKLTSL